MRQKTLRASITIIAAAAALANVAAVAAGQPAATRTASESAILPIPGAIATEHAAIHEALVSATRSPGRVGAAAQALAQVLHPHFVREEQVALPPLGLLAPLARGESIPQAAAAEALKMSDTLRAELPRMLAEHATIRTAVAALRKEARAAGATEIEELADELALHAQTEEEVLYPAAVLVGDLLRARRAR